MFQLFSTFHKHVCGQVDPQRGSLNTALSDASCELELSQLRDVEKGITTHMGQTIAASGPTQTRLTWRAGTRRTWAGAGQYVQGSAQGTRPSWTEAKKLRRLVRSCANLHGVVISKRTGPMSVHIHPCWGLGPGRSTPERELPLLLPSHPSISRNRAAVIHPCASYSQRCFRDVLRPLAHQVPS